MTSDKNLRLVLLIDDDEISNFITEKSLRDSNMIQDLDILF